MDLQTLKRLFRDVGCRRLYAKTLADNWQDIQAEVIEILREEVSQ